VFGSVLLIREEANVNHCHREEAFAVEICKYLPAKQRGDPEGNPSQEAAKRGDCASRKPEDCHVAKLAFASQNLSLPASQ